MAYNLIQFHIALTGPRLNYLRSFAFTKSCIFYYDKYILPFFSKYRTYLRKHRFYGSTLFHDYSRTLKGKVMYPFITNSDR